MRNAQYPHSDYREEDIFRQLLILGTKPNVCQDNESNNWNNSNTTYGYKEKRNCIPEFHLKSAFCTSRNTIWQTLSLINLTHFTYSTYLKFLFQFHKHFRLLLRDPQQCLRRTAGFPPPLSPTLDILRHFSSLEDSVLTGLF